MRIEPFLRRTAPLLAAGALTLGLFACGSGDDDTGESAATGTTTQDADQKPDGQNGQFKPEKKAPDSATDKKKAPDDVISDRPGGPASPVKP